MVAVGTAGSNESFGSPGLGLQVPAPMALVKSAGPIQAGASLQDPCPNPLLRELRLRALCPLHPGMLGHGWPTPPLPESLPGQLVLAGPEGPARRLLPAPWLASSG